MYMCLPRLSPLIETVTFYLAKNVWPYWFKINLFKFWDLKNVLLYKYIHFVSIPAGVTLKEKNSQTILNTSLHMRSSFLDHCLRMYTR